jgi:hypothetical protein
VGGFQLDQRLLDVGFGFGEGFGGGLGLGAPGRGRGLLVESRGWVERYLSGFWMYWPSTR